MMEYLFRNFLASWILPPGLFIALAFVALWKFKHVKQTLFYKFALLISVTFYLLSTSLVAKTLMAWVEVEFQPIKAGKEQAIVVLGGGNRNEAPEFGGQTVSLFALERLRYAARLHRQTGLPVLVTGSGKIWDGVEAEAKLMAKTLKEDFAVRPFWIEQNSRNTFDNALNSYKILENSNKTRIYLVSDAFHLKRAIIEFERVGFQVTPAPTSFRSGQTEKSLIYRILPSVTALLESSIAMKELLGRIWYILRY